MGGDIISDSTGFDPLLAQSTTDGWPRIGSLQTDYGDLFTARGNDLDAFHVPHGASWIHGWLFKKVKFVCLDLRLSHYFILRIIF